MITSIHCSENISNLDYVVCIQSNLYQINEFFPKPIGSAVWVKLTFIFQISNIVERKLVDLIDL